MVGRVSFKKKWNNMLRSFILLVLFIFIPFEVLFLCLLIGFGLCWTSIFKICRKGRCISGLRPKISDRRTFSIVRYTILLSAYLIFLVLFWTLILLIYLAISVSITGLSFAVLLPLFYFYAIVIFFRKIIVWSGR